MSQVIVELDGTPYPASGGERLLDVFDDAMSQPLPVSCRAGNCGTCRVRVIEGESALVPPTAAEQNLLDLCGAQRNERLGCQIRVKASGAVGRVRIERV
jgi:ferredoxin